MMVEQTPPVDIECIIPPKSGKCGLYIGNLSAALSLPTLKRTRTRDTGLEIRAVVSMAKGGFLSHSEEDLPNYLYIQAYDKHDFDLTPYFETTYEFIERHRKRTNVPLFTRVGVGALHGWHLTKCNNCNRLSHEKDWKIARGLLL